MHVLPSCMNSMIATIVIPVGEMSVMSGANPDRQSSKGKTSMGEPAWNPACAGGELKDGGLEE